MATDVIAERVALNQSTFREANEQIEQQAETLGLTDGSVPFICECPAEECTSIVQLGLPQYETIRSRGDWFLATPGHEVCIVDGREVAIVVERHDSYSLMQKIGEAAERAKELDPRS
jgi:hypothetical protein